MQITNDYNTPRNKIQFQALITKRIPEPLETFLRSGERELFSKMTTEHDVFITATPLRTLTDPFRRRMPKLHETCNVSYGFKNLFGIKGLSTKRDIRYSLYEDMWGFPQERIYTTKKVDLAKGVCAVTGEALDTHLNQTTWRNLRKINRNIKKDKNLVERVYLTPNHDGNILIHTRHPDEHRIDEYNRLDFDSLYDSINSTVGKYPDLLAKMYLTPDASGHLFADKARPTLKVKMIEALKNQPETLIQIYTHRAKPEGRMTMESITSREEYVALKEVLKHNEEGRTFLQALDENRRARYIRGEKI